MAIYESNVVNMVGRPNLRPQPDRRLWHILCWSCHSCAGGVEPELESRVDRRLPLMENPSIDHGRKAELAFKTKGNVRRSGDVGEIAIALPKN